MLGNKQGIGRATGVLALGLAAAGCSGGDVSAGSEGDTVNLSRCYGADCGLQAQALQGDEGEARPCEGEVEGPLADPLVFEEISPQMDTMAAVEASDGSVWALERLRPTPVEPPAGPSVGPQSIDSSGRTFATLHLAHFSSAGALLGTQELASEAEHTQLSGDLTVDAAGVVTVGIYSIFAPNADSELIERLELTSFDNELTPLGAARRFRGMAVPRLTSGPTGSIWLAGNADANAPHGVIARISHGEPDWIQTSVPSAGQSVSGVSGVTVADDGTAAVIANMTPKNEDVSDQAWTAGVSTFDGEGNPLWTLQLPTAYDPGNPFGFGGTARGDLIVSGTFDGGRLLVRGVSRDGELGWAYTFDNTFSSSVEVRRASGRAFVSTLQGLAVIDEDGSRCRRFSIPLDDAAGATAEPWRPDAEYVLSIGRLVRFRVPE